MSRPNRRGSFANTAVWTCALLAIGGLTVWKFEIWPVDWVATETGTLDETAVGAERLAAAPIEVAVSETATDTVPQVEPAVGTADHAPPPSQLSSLNIENTLPVAPDQEPPNWPSEPARLPPGGNAKPLRSVPSSAPLTGADFADIDRFSETPDPSSMPPEQTEPAPLERPTESRLRPAGAETKPASIVPSSAEELPTNEFESPVAFPNEAVDPRLAAIDADLEANRILPAHKALSKLYWDEPGLRGAIAGRIDATARSIYFDPQPHYMAPYEVAPGDQLRIFARQYNVPWEYLARLNRIDDPSRIKAGQRIKVIKGPFAAAVDLSDFTLTIHAHGYYVRRYPVGIGKDGSTPMGTFRVVLKEADPKYYGPDVVMERDDPANPLGERWIGLDDGSGHVTSYGIHGTIEPGSIGKAESRGCIRLRNEDVAEVYDLLGVGSEVAIQR